MSEPKYVKPEYYMTRSDGVKLFIFRSKENRKLIQVETGIVYSEAIDVEGAPYTYSESEEFNEEPWLEH